MAVNLRGLRESGTIFALPTYMFVLGVMLVVGVGIDRAAARAPPHVTGMTAIGPGRVLSLLLLLRAFADGSAR